MAQKSLVSYIKGMLKKGYSLNSIRSALVKSGYSMGVIEEAINYSHAPRVKHEIHLSKSTWIAAGILFLGLVIVAVSMAVLKSDTTTPQKLLDLKVDILGSFVEKGSNVEFNVNILSFGTDKRYDVKLNYNILDQKNKIVKFKTETTAVETRTSLKSSVGVPENLAAGEYTLKVIAEYDGSAATAADSFTVIEKTVKEQITEPELKPEKKPEPKPEPITEPETKPEPEEEPEPLTTDCADIKEDDARDDCYSATAETISQSGICGEIADDSKRDVCYTNFVANGDYSVCEELTLRYLKDSCKQLRALDKLQNE